MTSYCTKCTYRGEGEWVQCQKCSDKDRHVSREAGLLIALREISERDWVENCLDPQWAAVRAHDAISAYERAIGV